MDMTTRDGINAALKIIGLMGLAGTAVVAPNALQGLSLILKKSSAKKSDHNRILKELKRQGLVHITQKDDTISYTLTPAGAHRLQRVMVEEVRIPRPKKWDKKWRIVTFDIPVKQSAGRAAFTQHLQNLGFFMIQKSMWVYPYPCFEQIDKIAGHYNILRYCTLLEVGRLDELSTRRLLSRFKELC